MNVSIAEPTISPCVPSQSHMKFPPASSTSQTGRKQQKRPRKIYRALPEDDPEDDAYKSHLSATAKNRVLKLRKIQDPFDDVLQQFVDDVFDLFEEQEKGEISLAEYALLLSGLTQVFAKQTNTLHEEVLAMVERYTGRPNPLRKNRKRKGQGEEENAPQQAIDKTGEAAEGEGLTNAENSSNEKDTADNIATHEDNSEVTPDSLVTSAAEPTASTSNPGNSQDLNETELQEIKPAENPGVGVKLDESELTVQENQNMEQEVLDEIPDRCTRRQSDRLKNVLTVEKIKGSDYISKKKKYDEDPPNLISCHDEWNEILKNNEDNIDMEVGECEPPDLVMMGRKLKQLTISNDEENHDYGDVEACQSSCGDKPESVKDMKCELVTQSASKSAADAESADARYDTLDHLSADAQERFHLLVQNMHKMPFDHDINMPDGYGYKAYQQKFFQAVSLLSEHSVLVKRSQEDNPKSPSEPLKSNDSQIFEGDKALSSISELLQQVRLQAAEDYKLNKGSQTKTDAEVPIGQMIATLKRIICNRYNKLHLKTDGDKAVYRRIREFTDRVNAVLKKEAEQGLFDVRKYEMEILDASIKESHEIETGELPCPLSPIMLPDGAQSPRVVDSINPLVSSPSRRSSLNGSVDGTSWIRFTDLFSHKKAPTHSETCRHFYATLGLLSEKKLTMNYDNLFSPESAEVVTKMIKKGGEVGDTEKYPVGSRIMTSRCPDLDRDDVMLAPGMISESLRLAIEQGGSLTPSDYQSDSQASGGAAGGGYVPLQSIADAMNDFVPDDDDDDDDGEPFTDDPLSK